MASRPAQGTKMSFIITHLPPNATQVWNTTITNSSNTYGTLSSLIGMLTTNFPWFFPLITMILMLLADYAFVMTSKQTKLSYTLLILFIYTMIMYVEIGGAIVANSGMFFLFASLFALGVLVINLFSG
jgi:hypothetical protein